MRTHHIIAASVLCLAGCASKAQLADDGVKTTFQTGSAWRPSIDNRADAVMVYGVGGNPSDPSGHSVEDRIRSWKERGYTTHFMTGIAWGEYQDYFTGAWDGRAHFDEGQVQQNGDTIWHGHLVPYIVPSENYLKYIKECHVRRVIDAGIDAIFMEEPEFWMRAGYSQAFRKEWEKFYGFAWRPQHESPENTWLSHKLKYHLYYNALKEVFTYAKAYGKSLGRDIKCYVPTHSLINYSQWAIVSPEASLASLDCVDGYIAQVWTGTSRTNNYYNGRLRERVFETAWLEYGSMESMTAPTGRKMFFLTDPIEDQPRDWDDFRRNYQATFAAQLMYPNIANYEVMPWPERVYDGMYRIHAGSEEKSYIPRSFSTQMQVMINSLNKMPLSDNKVSGTEGITVMMANSLMFQQYPSHAGYKDPQLSNFYGLALPFLKRGIPVRTAHLENLAHGALDGTKVLLMTYSSMKPMNPETHEHLAAWVRKGGTLVYCSRDTDPFQNVMEWWNQNGNRYAAPADHLFSLMQIPQQAKAGSYRYGKGTVQIIRQDPKEFVMDKGGDKELVSVVENLYGQAGRGESLQLKNHLSLQRGMFRLVAVLDEGVSDEPFRLEGTFIDLFHPELPVCRTREIRPGEQGYFIDMDQVRKNKPQVLASGSRESDEAVARHSYAYTAKGPQRTTAVSRVWLPSKPVSVKVNGREVMDTTAWHAPSQTYLLKYENDPDGVRVEFVW